MSKHSGHRTGHTGSAHPRGRPTKTVGVPPWYQPIQNKIAFVREEQAPSVNHLLEVVAIGELMAGALPVEVKNEISEVLRQIDRLKVQLRAFWLDAHPDPKGWRGKADEVQAVERGAV